MIDDQDWETTDLSTFNERRIFAEMGIDEHPDGSVSYRLLDQQRLVSAVLAEADAGFQRCVIEKRLSCFPKTKQAIVDYVVTPMICDSAAAKLVLHESFRLVLPDGKLQDFNNTLTLPEQISDRLTEICESVCEDQKHW
jgi:hypothetical protein